MREKRASDEQNLSEISEYENLDSLPSNEEEDVDNSLTPLDSELILGSAISKSKKTSYSGTRGKKCQKVNTTRKL